MQAKKSLGQHFLNSKHVLGQIIAAGEIRPGATVLEIGPGTGILTRGLLDAGAIVLAIEKDDRAIQVLEDAFEAEIADERLKIIHGDILDENIFTSSSLPSDYSLIANIPYYITGAILEKFLEHEPRPDRIVLLVQKEVAERIVARDGKESILSISVKAFGTPKIVAKVPPGAFTPPPTVDSAIISIKDISNDKLKGVDIAGFFKIVKAGFAHKRKYLKRNLEAAISDPQKIDFVWKKLNLDEKIRAEDMPPQNWASLSTEFQKIL